MPFYSHDVLTRALVCNDAEHILRDKETTCELLANEPDGSILLHYRGILEFQRGRLDQACEYIKKGLAIAPDSAELYCTYAKILTAQKKYVEAIAAFEHSIFLKPTYATAYYGFGSLYLERGDDANSIKAYQDALAIDPDYPNVLNDLGLMLKDKGQLAKAAKCFIRAIRAKPDYPMALNNLGVLYLAVNRLDEAESLYRQALACKPDYPAALNNLGNVLHYKGMFEDSISLFTKALALQPDYPNALNNLGNALKNIGHLPEAIAAFKQAIALKSDCPDYHFNLSMALLAAGRFHEGWRAFESRWETPQFASLRQKTTKPRWEGETGEGRVLLIRAEQGLGDTLQFCRYAPLAAARGLRVILEVQPALVNLMGSLAGVERTVAQGRPLPDFDFYCPMMSLPLAFGTRLETIPAIVPYLSVPDECKHNWQNRLPDDKKANFRVGLVWAGKPRFQTPDLIAVDRRRSIAADLLAPLMDIDGIQFYSLQKDGPGASKEFGPIDLMDECRDFVDTAALICNLDLVISVDTSVAHLAGALGKPVWMLNRFDTCWRWLQDREDSPWYPTMRLFRQPSPGDWQSVILRVKRELIKAYEGS
jgi:tetratricopeptide (TPR) repeat protein